MWGRVEKTALRLVLWGNMQVQIHLIALCVLSLSLCCVAQQASEKEQGTNSGSKKGRSVDPPYKMRFNCGVASADPTNQAFNVNVDFYNEGHSTVGVGFRLGVEANQGAPSYYDYESDARLRPGTTGRWSVAVIAEAQVGDALDAHGKRSVSIQCTIDNVRVCVLKAEKGSELSSENCVAGASFARILKLPPDKVWNCFEEEEAGVRCKVVQRPASNCLAAVCLGDMIWVRRAREWYAFDGVDWASCKATDLNANPDEVWKKCGPMIRERQRGFNPGEYVPLSPSNDPTISNH